MPVVRIDLEVDDKGSAKISQVSGQLKDLGGSARSAGDAIKNGFMERIGHQALDGLLAVMKAVPTALLGAAEAAIAYGGHLTDMEARTGVAVEGQQELDHAAKLVGLTFGEDLVPAIAKMQQALVDAPEKFMRLGMSVTDLRKLKPEDQFQAIAERIAEIKDPAERSAAAIEIFGKSGAVLLPLLTSNIKAAREEAVRLGLVMSADVAHAADDLGDSIDTLTAVWDGLIRNFAAAIVTSEPLHQLIQGLTQILGGLSKEVNSDQSSFRSFVDQGVVFLANALVPLTEGVEFAAAIFKALADVWTGVVFSGKVLAETLVLIYKATTSPSTAKQSWEDFKKSIDDALTQANDDLAKHEKALEGVVGVTSKVKDAAQHLADVVANSVGVTHKADEADRHHTLTLGEKIEAQKKLAGELKKYTLAIQEEFDRLLKAEAEDQEQMDRLTDEFIKDVRRQKEALADANAAINAYSIEKYAKQIEEGAAKLLLFSDAAYGLAGALGGAFGAAFGGVSEVLDAFAAHAQQAAENVRKTGDEAQTGTQKMVAYAGAIIAVASAYNAGKAAGSGMEAAMSGAAKGAAAGTAVMPGYGTAIGAVVGAIAGLIGHHKAAAAAMEKARAESAKMRDEFVKQQGGFNELARKALEAGVSIDALFAARSPEAAKKAIQELTDAFDLQKEAQAALNDAVQRYGFTIEELGPKFAKQKLDEQMAQVYQDWQILTAAGVDHGAMLEKVGPGVGKLVDQYVAAGVEIPAAMKPIIDDLFEHHRLLHENGEEYTDAEYKALGYGHTTGEMFDTLIRKVTDLVNALLGIHDKTVNIDINENHHVSHDDDGGGGGGGDDRGEENRATGFEGWVMPRPGGKRFRAAEAGRAEYVSISPNGPPTRRGDGGGGLSTIVIPLSIDGKEVTKVVMKRLRTGWDRVA